MPLIALFPMQYGKLVPSFAPLLLKTPKENLFRRVLNFSMKRDRQHGPTIQINRVLKNPTDENQPKWMGNVIVQV